MLGQKDATATVAVKDLAAAKRFYEGKLGLAAAGGEEEMMVSYTTGATSLFVYVSQFAGTNQATAVTWALGGDFDATVAALRDKGVVFEQYDGLPDTRREGDVHLSGEMRIAWFKDPDGNIHNIHNG